MTVIKYRKKVTEVEALQYVEGNVDEVVEWVTANNGTYYFTESFNGELSPLVVIETSQDSMTVKPNDYIVRNADGEMFPCKPEIFTLIYEPVWGSNVWIYEPVWGSNA